MSDSYSPTLDVTWNRTDGNIYENTNNNTTNNTNSTSSQDKVSESAVSESQQTGVKKEADKEYIETEFTTLRGTLRLMPSEESMLIKIGDIISLNGIGKNLSGNYFVDEIQRTIDSSNGYSMELVVVKTAFGGKIVKKQEDSSGQREKPKTVEK